MCATARGQRSASTGNLLLFAGLQGQGEPHARDVSSSTGGGWATQQGLRRTSEASPSDFAQPIKRTRSEQGLAGILADAQQAEAQALLAQQQQQQQHTQRGRADLLKHFTAAPPAASPSGTDSESDRGASPPCAVATGAPQQGAGGLALGAGRGSWMSSLAPVLSDMGSSTNSLVSLESDMTRSSASHPALQLLAPPGGAGACAGAAGTPRQLGRPATPPQPVPRAGSAAAVSYLQAAGSAASLQHGNLGGTTGFSSGGRSAPWPQYVTGSLLYRTQSDLSDAATCSAASGGRFAPPPPPAHSPPPLIPAGPVRASSFLLEGSAAPPELRRLRTAAAAPAGPAVTAVAAAPEAPLQQLPAALGGAAAAFGAGTRAPVFATAAAAFCDAGGAAAAGWAQGLAGGARARGGLAALRAQAPITPGLCSVASLPSFPSAAPAAPAGLASGEAEADGWDFGRRARQQRLARTGSSGCVPGAGGRRRSSIEASMPWRARVDGAIAAAAVSEARLPPEPEEGPPQPEPEPAAGALPWEQQGRGLWQEEGDEGDEEEGGEGDAEAQWRQWRERQPGAGGARPSPGSASGSAAGSRGRSSTDSESDGGGRRASGGSSDAGRSGCSPAVGAGASQRLGKVRRGGAGASAYASSYYARENSGGAAFELFLRLNRARQTLDFAKRQAQQFAELEVAEMTVWEALDALAELREFEAGLAPASEGLDPSFSLRDHAFQVAELCRLAFPDKEWLALVGLLHGLGKLLAHPTFGSQPQWAVAGETYPLGCRFAPQVGHSELFSANPDRRRRAFSTADGVYTPGCGLKEVYMSWGAPEYLYLVMVLNQVPLPEEALFILRHQKFYSLTRPGGAYQNLLSPGDAALLPLLSAFQRLAVYKRVELPPAALRGAALHDYYAGLVAKYIGPDKLFW